LLPDPFFALAVFSRQLSGCLSVPDIFFPKNFSQNIFSWFTDKIVAAINTFVSLLVAKMSVFSRAA